MIFGRSPPGGSMVRLQQIPLCHDVQRPRPGVPKLSPRPASSPSIIASLTPLEVASAAAMVQRSTEDRPDLNALSTVDTGALPHPLRPEAARHYLLVFDSESTRMFLLPPGGDVLIGRAKEADLRLKDGSVSRTHAKLSVLPSGVRITDLESHNGTLVNDEKIV